MQGLFDFHLNLVPNIRDESSNSIIDELVKSRHTREGWYPETLQLFKKTGFPIKDFGNDGLEKDFLRDRHH